MFENHTWSWTNLRVCVGASWSPQIGDPNVTGWLTVLAYALCLVLSIAVVTSSARHGREKTFWILVAALLAFLGVNKQLDLQSALTATGRCLSQLQGWYTERREIQKHFIQVLLAATVLALALGAYLMRRDLRRNALAILGLCVVSSFVAVRAVGFHRFDAFINSRMLDMRVNFLFELSGLVLIALNAIVLLARLRRP